VTLIVADLLRTVRFRSRTVLLFGYPFWGSRLYW